jgi:hypothetical protein
MSDQDQEHYIVRSIVFCSIYCTICACILIGSFLFEEMHMGAYIHIRPQCRSATMPPCSKTDHTPNENRRMDVKGSCLPHYMLHIFSTYHKIQNSKAWISK